MPPYIIFADRTLTDLCVRLPRDQQELLEVSGIGEHKAQKYGRRFLDEIAEFLAEHPGTILSVVTVGTGAGWTPKRKRKEAFYLNPEDAEKFPYRELCYISEMKDRLNEICSAEFVKKVTISVIWAYLMEIGLTVEEQREGRFCKVPTEKGRQLGIRMVDKVSQSGMEYQLPMYSEQVQRLVVEHFVQLGEKSGL